MKTIKNRNKNGRPVKGLSEKKAYKVTVKMATEEFYTLKAKAKEAGINRCEFIRCCIRSGVVRQRITPDLMTHIRQLCGMANNVNQIARTANATGYFDVHQRCLEMNERIGKVIKQIDNDG
ncbi:plasmid mobilization relaxosome protein MobC [Labilibacter sediminis]|nr:plasmid mobilization relaxosome protein MobC [Labilibacter sediminis]